MINPRLDTAINLPDGRRLSFVEYGESTGTPMMLFHGLPGSRLAWGLLPGDPFPAGVRVIAPDRPGYGRSDPKPGRSLLDWTKDVAVLADHLQLDRFCIAGVSGGGPGALACAFKMPERLRSVGVVAGAAPTDAPGVFDGMSTVNRFFTRLAWHAPYLSALNTRFIATIIQRDPSRYIAIMQRKVHDVDRAALTRSDVRDMLIKDFTEALHLGGQGMVDDMQANHGRSWGFPLEQISVPVMLWYATLDRSVPQAMGRYLAQMIPNAEHHLVPNAGHLWPLLNMRQILTTVAQLDNDKPDSHTSSFNRTSDDAPAMSVKT